jgi:hypothetical protein
VALLVILLTALLISGPFFVAMKEPSPPTPVVWVWVDAMLAMLAMLVAVAGVAMVAVLAMLIRATGSMRWSWS